MTTRRPGPAVAKRQLRLKLRQGRLDANMTQNDIAEATGWSPSKVLRLENGQTPIYPADMLALLTLLPSLGNERDELLQLVKDARRPTLSNRYSDVLPPPFAEWLEHEAYAVHVYQFENQFVPGVLQTDAYATGIVNGILGRGTDPTRTQKVIDARIERAEPLLGPEGPRMDFIIDEASLRRAVGNEDGSKGLKPMIDQLQHLKRHNTMGRAALGETIEPEINPAISVQIWPMIKGAYSGLGGPFELIEFPGGDINPMVYFENRDGDAIVRDDVEVIAQYLDLFAELKQEVPSAADTNRHLDTIIELMENGQNGIELSPRPARKPRKTTPAAG
ncbi:helix-turn-helix transcriptional regulator [Dactylosporangium sp. NPDC051541]|uniref:helix-turn-helix transcriptional regulator n=1 Tax=Dactylosporangium sp. NPDC051541 TaxID=3363977 RepID=UPI00378B5883